MSTQFASLSPREREILELVATGKATKEIADGLDITESTVNWHVSNVLGKINASSRAEAVALALGGPGPVPSEVARAPGGRRRFRRYHLSVLTAIVLAAALVALGGIVSIAGASVIDDLRTGQLPFTIPPRGETPRQSAAASPSAYQAAPEASVAPAPNGAVEPQSSVATTEVSPAVLSVAVPSAPSPSTPRPATAPLPSLPPQLSDVRSLGSQVPSPRLP